MPHSLAAQLVATAFVSPDHRDVFWLIILKTIVVFGFLMVMTLFMIWAERRVVARMQQRLGPNRVGPFGILQGLADGIKLALKEDLIPSAADRIVFIIAPIISAIPAFMAFAVIPFGPTVSIFGKHTNLQLTDLPVAVLFVLAMSSMGIYGIVLAGWSSGSTYPLLGGVRSAAQMISYEVAMGLSFVGVFIQSGSLSTSEIVATQQQRWFCLTASVSFLIYAIAMVGETNRAPFDLPEAEGELVGGFHTEYTSLKFALFFLAEYINMVTVSALMTTLFLGGWRAPWPISLWSAANTGWWPLLWFFGKLFVVLFVFIWLRGTLPRLRYDQFMKLGWKVLIPANLLWIMAEASIKVLDRKQLIYGIVIIAIVVIVGSFIYDSADQRKRREREAEEELAAAAPFDPYAGGFPVPPMPGQHLPSRRPVPILASSVCSGPELTARRPDDPSGGGLVRSSMASFFGPVKGFGVTFATMFKPVNTELYPEQKKITMPRFHGRHVLNRHPDGLEKCVGCELCAWACPADAIYVEGADNTDEERFSPGERYGRVYQINYLRCILCGLCIEACPTRALTMSNEFEMADDNRADLIFTKEQLLAPLAPGMELPPHPMRLADAKDYYRGTPAAHVMIGDGDTEEVKD